MNSSPTITKISAAMVKAQRDMGNAKKDAMNPFFKKTYADLNSVREAVLPSLNANGVSVIQPTCIIDGKNYVETILLHESGEYISSFTEIICDKPNDAQRHGSGLSYARRYALASIVNIGAEDDDANKAVGKQDTTWHLTTEQQAELQSLINNSTLTKERKDKAAEAVVKAKSDADIQKIKTALLKEQKPTV